MVSSQEIAGNVPKVIKRVCFSFLNCRDVSSNTVYVYTGHINNNVAGLVVHLFLDGMFNLKLTYFSLVFLFNLSPS